MPYCRNCGAAIGDAARFCPKCGKQTADSGSTKPEVSSASPQPLRSVAAGKTSLMSPDTAAANLKRAWGLIDGVSKATEELRRRVVQHEQTLDQMVDAPGMGGFLGSMIAGMQRKGQLGREKSSLMNDLQLASQEIDKAVKIKPESGIHIESGTLGVPQMRAVILGLSGQIEMVWGTSQKAIDFFSQALQIEEHPDYHYMIGLCYESEHKPKMALIHFEKCLELDPAGELSVPALKEASAMRNYKKRFRGDWGTFFLLLLIWPAAIWYFVRNWK